MTPPQCSNSASHCYTSVSDSLPSVSSVVSRCKCPFIVSDSSSICIPSTMHCKNHSGINKEEMLWHQRFGHIPFVRLRDISGIPYVFSSKQSFVCSICPMARQSRLLFPDSSIKSSHPFQLIHVDTWGGPYSTPTYNGFKYFLTIVDDFSRATWTHLMGSKNNAFPLLKALIALVHTQFSTKVQSVRSDNALELGSSNLATQLFRDQGIIHQISCSHTPQQNGVVERKYKYLLETSRGLLFSVQITSQILGGVCPHFYLSYQ